MTAANYFYNNYKVKYLYHPHVANLRIADKQKTADIDDINSSARDKAQ